MYKNIQRFCAVVIISFLVISGIQTYRQEQKIDEMRHAVYNLIIIIEDMQEQAEIEGVPPEIVFTSTAYCPCEKCCGAWAQNRPDGKVYGASGRELIPGYSIAVDPEIIPLGSIVEIDGRKYRADDTGGAVQGYRIDFYKATHEEAEEYGKKDIEVIING